MKSSIPAYSMLSGDADSGPTRFSLGKRPIRTVSGPVRPVAAKILIAEDQSLGDPYALLPQPGEDLAGRSGAGGSPTGHGRHGNAQLSRQAEDHIFFATDELARYLGAPLSQSIDDLAYQNLGRGRSG